MTHTQTSPRPSPVLLGTGTPSLLGLTRTGAGTNVAVHAPQATSLHLCLLREDGTEERPAQEIALPERTDGVWHGLVEPISAGTRYGLRADGPHVPALSLRFDADRLLLDPYARAVGRHADGWCAVVTDPADDEGYDWGDDAPPRHPWDRTVIYEAHVKGITMQHPDVPQPLRGTYAGLAHPAVTAELVRLGITAVELLPVHQFASEPGLLARGATNYWGYNSLAFFAPHDAYASRPGAQLREFKDMVRALHAAGLEVLLDVVYNHTAEGGPDLPALSLRGLDDDAYYLHPDGGDGTDYLDVTGCGNTVRAEHPVTSRLILDSLRYWVSQMHVDGFRFDLASVLARQDRHVEPDARLLRAIADDPALVGTKLIAEPWDATPEGYLVGRFPAGWSEWNDTFRDTVRDFWRGHAHGVRELASRLRGSTDLYAGGRHPWASVNFVTSHDGFTLRDAVSYEAKHNEDNGEDNRDGHGDNRTWNCGTEGETDDEGVLALRRRQAANLLGTVLLATGVPMLTAGDERGRTQRGNNNAYCQDNEVSWLDWSPDEQWEHLGDLTRRLTGLRAAHPVLRQPPGRALDDGEGRDLAWFHPAGREMTSHDWRDPSVQGVGMYVSGTALDDASFLLLFDAGPQVGPWVLPGGAWADAYDVELDTSATLSGRIAAAAPVDVADRCLVVLRAITAQSDATRSDAATDRTTSV